MILRQPIVTFSSSQSTDPLTDHGNDKSQNIDDQDEVFDFSPLNFDDDEDNVADEAINSAKQYKILNYKMNMIFQFLNDSYGNSSSFVSIDFTVIDIRLEV